MPGLGFGRFGAVGEGRGEGFVQGHAHRLLVLQLAASAAAGIRIGRQLAAKGEQAAGCAVTAFADFLENVDGHHVGRVELGFDDAGGLVFVVVRQGVGEVDLQALGQLELAALVAFGEVGTQREIREHRRHKEHYGDDQEQQQVELEAHAFPS